MQQLNHIESFCRRYFLDLLLPFHFFNHLGKSIYDLPPLRLISLRLQYNASTASKTKFTSYN